MKQRERERGEILIVKELSILALGFKSNRSLPEVCYLVFKEVSKSFFNDCIQILLFHRHCSNSIGSIERENCRQRERERESERERGNEKVKRNAHKRRK